MTTTGCVTVCLACASNCQDGGDLPVDDLIKTEPCVAEQLEEDLGFDVAAAGVEEGEDDDDTSELEMEDSLFHIFCKLLGVKMTGIKLEGENRKTMSEGDTSSVSFSTSPFCGTCKNVLRQLMKLKLKLRNLELELKTGIQELKTLCEKSEVQFGTTQIYEQDARYLRIREQICPAIKLPGKAKDGGAPPTRKSGRKRKPISFSDLDLISSDLIPPEDASLFSFQDEDVLSPLNNDEIFIQDESTVDTDPLQFKNDEPPYFPDLEAVPGPSKKGKVGRPSRKDAQLSTFTGTISRSSKRKVNVIADDEDSDYSPYPSNDKHKKRDDDCDYNPLDDNHEESSEGDVASDDEDVNEDSSGEEDGNQDANANAKIIADPTTGNLTIFGFSFEKLDKDKYQCLKCQACCPRSYIKLHTIGKHTDMFQCSQCGKRNSSSKALKEHIRGTHKNQRKLQIDPGTGAITFLNVTFEKTDEEGKYRCLKCNLFYSIRNLKHHAVCKHTDMFVCPTCDQHCRSGSHLADHIERVHGKGRPKKECPICGKPCSTAGTRLLTHMATHLGAEEKEAAIARGETIPDWKKNKTHFCDQCGRSYTDSYLLKLHKIRDHPSEEHTEADKLSHKVMCPECGKLIGKYHMKFHLRTMHSSTKEENKRFVCSVCDKRFFKMCDLRKHKQAVHEQLRPFQCSSCPRRFKRTTDLKGHMNVCQNNRPFQCELCFIAFGRKHHLDRHIAKASCGRPQSKIPTKKEQDN